jgi:hypothetical protein
MLNLFLFGSLDKMRRGEASPFLVAPSFGKQNHFWIAQSHLLQFQNAMSLVTCSIASGRLRKATMDQGLGNKNPENKIAVSLDLSTIAILSWKRVPPTTIMQGKRPKGKRGPISRRR